MGIVFLKGFQLALRWLLYINAIKSYKTHFLHVYPLPKMNLISQKKSQNVWWSLFLLQFNCSTRIIMFEVTVRLKICVCCLRFLSKIWALIGYLDVPYAIFELFKAAGVSAGDVRMVPKAIRLRLNSRHSGFCGRGICGDIVTPWLLSWNNGQLCEFLKIIV